MSEALRVLWVIFQLIVGGIVGLALGCMIIGMLIKIGAVDCLERFLKWCMDGK